MGKLLIPGILVGVGVGLAVVAVIVGFVVVPDIINGEIEATLQLTNNSDTFNDWVLNPVPVYLKSYIWHVNNPDWIALGQKPNLTDKGPYVFSERREKHVTKIDEDADTVTYRQKIWYYFEPSMSKDADGNQLSLDDIVNVVNLPYIAISTTLASMNIEPLDDLLYRMYTPEDTFVKTGVTVGQVLFEGWEYPPIYSALLALSGDEQPQFHNGSFGYYRGRNGSDDGEYVIKGGFKDSSTFAQVVTWNGQPALNFWDHPADETDGDKYPDPKYCNMINGTDGGIFPPFLTRESRVQIFVTDICRSVDLLYVGDVEHKGILGYKFQFSEAFYMHPEDNPDNWCFCPSPPDPELENSCSKGLVRLFTCEGGPIVTSSPHFYGAEETEANKVIGMKPIQEDHDTYLVLQPDTGLPLIIRKRVQMSVEIQNFNNTFNQDFDNLEYITFPILWVSEEIDLNDEMADEVKAELLTPLQIVDVAMWVIVGVGGVMALVGIGLYVKRR